MHDRQRGTPTGSSASGSPMKVPPQLGVPPVQGEQFVARAVLHHTPVS
ncbi:hypothetical protein ACFY1L_45930 [Streptomyces sp. NPDC001663]